MIQNDWLLKKVFLSLFSLFLFNEVFAQEFTSYKQFVPGSNIYFKMVPIPAGNFTIGNTDKKIEMSGFWMGAFEVTRDEFDIF